MKKSIAIFSAAGFAPAALRFCLSSILRIGNIRYLEPVCEAAAADLGQNHAVVGVGGMNDL